MASEREIRRRRVLALGGSTLASLAGCPSRSDTETPTETAIETATTTERRTETTGDETETTATASTAGFSDDFGDGQLGRYRPVVGSLDPWSVTEKLDGESALVDTTGGGAETLLAPPADALSWSGGGTVTVDVQFGTDPPFRNCKVGLGDVPNGPSTYVQVTPRQIFVSAPTGDARQRFPDIGVQGVHRLEIELGDDRITTAVDDEHRIELSVDRSFPAGTVAFGIEGSPTGTGGRTWFDNLAISPAE